MASNVLSAKGTVFSIKVGPTFVPIKGLTGFSGFNSGSAAIIDVTDLDSTRKEKQMGIPDEGSIKLDVNYIVTDPGQVGVDAARGTGAVTQFKCVSGTKQWLFDAFVPTFEKGAGVDKVWAGSITLEVTGEIVGSTVTP